MTIAVAHHHSLYPHWMPRASRLMPLSIMLMLLLALMAGGCQSQHVVERPQALIQAKLLTAQTIDGIGAGQGIEVRDGKVYLYGDRDIGIIREYTFDPAAMQLIYTGRQVELTQQGKDLVSHPTGLTHHPDYGTFLGDTVAGKGVIYHIDWQRLWADGNLDHAVLHVVQDDAAINGTRPEFVTYQGKVCIATSDYGDKDNAVRLYDPVKLKTARRTTEPGVMVQSMPCGAFVQSLMWDEHTQLLVLVQNTTPGLGWRLTGLKLEGPELKSQSPLRKFMPFDDFSPADELEGFHLLPGTGRTLSVFLTSSKQSNVWLGSVKLP